MFLTDLTFIEEGNKTFCESGKINFKKCTKIHTTIETMLKAQSIPYDIKPDPNLQEFFNNLPDIVDQDALDEAWFEKSREIEPPSETQSCEKFEIELPKDVSELVELVKKLLDHSAIKTVALKEKNSTEIDEKMEGCASPRKHQTFAFSILEIEKIVNEMKVEVFTSKKRYNMRVYKGTFLGTEGFAWIKDYFSFSDEKVCEFGSMLIEQGFIAPLTSGIKTFKNEEIVYRFVDKLNDETFLERKGSVLRRLRSTAGSF